MSAWPSQFVRIALKRAFADGTSPSRWIRSLYCAGSLRPYRRLATAS
jgi:hypothetical protein